MRLAVFCLVASAMLPSLTRAQAPVFKITPELSKIDFYAGGYSPWRVYSRNGTLR